MNQMAATCFLIAMVGCGALYGKAMAESSSSLTLDAGQVQWKRLSFFAKKKFQVEVSTQIDLASLPSSRAEAELPTSRQGIPIKLDSDRVSQMTVNTVIDPVFRPPVNIYNRIWFNPRDAEALGRIRLRRGEDDFKKIYRFTDRGVFRHRMEPKDIKEALQEPEKWTDIKDSFYPYNLTQLGCTIATERSLLLYILSAAEISKIGNSFSLCVFGKRQLHRLQLKQEGTYPVNVNFMDNTQPNEIRKQERINAIKIAITAEPMESDLNEVENFSFLGLHKDISIFIDPATHFPVQVSGIIPGIGTVHLKLNEVKTTYHPN